MNIDIIPQDQLARLSQLISDAETILITCHKSPDGDAIGSSLGLADYLRHLGKEPVVIVPDQYPDFLMWLPNTEKIIRYDKQRDKADLLFKIADLVFCLDYNAPSRVDEMEEALVSSPATRVLIDHHLNPDVPADLIISEPEASSTCELVFRLVWQMGVFPTLTKQFAVPIYCGMMTDTGGFTYNSSRPEIFFIISELLTKRIDKDKIYRNVYHNYSESRIRLMGYVMYEKLVYMPEYNAAYYTLTKDEASSRAMPKVSSTSPSRSKACASPSPCARIPRKTASSGSACVQSIISPATSWPRSSSTAAVTSMPPADASIVQWTRPSKSSKMPLLPTKTS